MCFVFIREQTATCATYSINWLVFITEIKSVYSAVRSGSLNKAVCASSFKGLKLDIQMFYCICPLGLYGTLYMDKWDIAQPQHDGQQDVLLTGKKHRRFEIYLVHLLRFEKGDEFLESIVTCDDMRWHICATMRYSWIKATVKSNFTVE
jgi:hypothetical protein